MASCGTQERPQGNPLGELYQHKGRAAQARPETLFIAVILAWSLIVQWSSRSIGFFYDDFLVFRHYSADLVLHAWWSDLAILTSPELWVHAYRPLTLAVHAITFEVCGFDPDHLLIARALLGTCTGVGTLVFVRQLTESSATALFCALLYLVFPVNFYAFTWNTEIAAVSTQVWLLLSFTSAIRYLHARSSIQYGLMHLFWAGALLTKEVAVPFLAVFPVMWVLYGARPNWKDAVRFTLPLAGLTAMYLAVRFAVLHGSWGAQGITPSQQHFLTEAIRNYVIYLSWIDYQLPIYLASGDHVSIFRSLVAGTVILLVMLPVVLAVIEIVRACSRVRFRTLVTDLRSRSKTEKQLLLGASMALIGGSICCFLPEPRIMFAAALGPVLALATLPDLLTRIGRFRIETVSSVCALVLPANAFWYFNLVHRPQGDFLRLRGLFNVESYYSLGHLYEEWGLQEQAEHLRAQLVAQRLIDAGTGDFQVQAFRDYLRSIGFSDPEAEWELRQVQGSRGAFQR